MGIGAMIAAREGDASVCEKRAVEASGMEVRGECGEGGESEERACEEN